MGVGRDGANSPVLGWFALWSDWEVGSREVREVRKGEGRGLQHGERGRKRGGGMTRISLQEAEDRFSEWLEQVERTGETVLICRFGRAVAQLSPSGERRSLEVDPVLSQVKEPDDWFGDESDEWEAMG